MSDICKRLEGVAWHLSKLGMKGMEQDIEEAIAEIKRLRSGWISVGIKPKEEKIYCVLVCGQGYKNVESYGYWNGEEWERVQQASEYNSIEPCFTDIGSQVTHYMEPALPPPPKESNDG